MSFFTNIISKIKKEHIIYFLAVCLLNIVFFFLLGNRKVLLEKDSYTYVKWSYLAMKKGYVLYPWFIKLIRIVHGEESFLTFVPIYQSAISIICNLVLVEYIKKKFYISHVLGVLSHIFILAPYTYTLPEAVSSHYVLTEGLSIPLFHISVYFILKGIMDRKHIDSFVAILLGVLLYLLRPQLAIVPILYICIIIIHLFYDWTQRKSKTYFKGVIFSILGIALIVGLCVYFAIIQSWANSRRNTQIIEATTGKALCLLTDEDVALYSGTDSEIYMELLADCRKNSRLISYFPRSILDYEQLHEIINGNVTAHETVIWEYFISIRGDDGGTDSFAIRNLITSTEIMNHKLAFVGIILRLMPSSLVASIFVQPMRFRSVCYIIAAFLYIAACIMLYFMKRKEVDKSYALPLCSVLIFVMTNSLECNVLLYGQQRYVIYCMGLFYISVIVAVVGCYRYRKNKGIGVGNNGGLR